MKALRRALSGRPRAGALPRRVGANAHARRETSRRSPVARWLAPSDCLVRAPLPVRRLIINACARRASVCTACGSVADSVHTADICFHPMACVRVAGRRGRCCLCEWHAIPDSARTRSRPTGQQAFSRPTHNRPTQQQATPPPTAARCSFGVRTLRPRNALRGRALSCHAVHGALRRDAMQAVSVTARPSRGEERPRATMGFLK